MAQIATEIDRLIRIIRVLQAWSLHDRVFATVVRLYAHQVTRCFDCALQWYVVCELHVADCSICYEMSENSRDQFKTCSIRLTGFPSGFRFHLTHMPSQYDVCKRLACINQVYVTMSQHQLPNALVNGNLSDQLGLEVLLLDKCERYACSFVYIVYNMLDDIIFRAVQVCCCACIACTGSCKRSSPSARSTHVSCMLSVTVALPILHTVHCCIRAVVTEGAIAGVCCRNLATHTCVLIGGPHHLPCA